MLLAATILSSANVEARALRLCRPAIARKAGGEIDRLTIDSLRRSRTMTTIHGQVTVFIGMAPAAPGNARTHHLIRSDFHYACSVRRGRLVKTLLTQP